MDPAPPDNETETALLAAARTYGRAKRAMDAHKGPRAGTEFEGKVNRWRRALLKLEEAAKALVEETETA